MPALASTAVNSLGELFSIAHESEPGYKAARANLDASRARTRQAFGAMLPQVSATASTNGNRRRYESLDRITRTMHDRYHGTTDQLSLTQPIWRAANVASLRQAHESAQQAQYQLEDAEQQLYQKLATAWFDLMEARDAVEFTTAQRDALHAQWDIARRGAELGAQGEPQADDARAKYEEASADEASAELDLATKLAALEQWVGPAEDLKQPHLIDNMELPNLLGDDLEPWMTMIDTHSPALRAAARAVAAADEEVSKQRAGHQPTLDMVASYGNNDQNVGNFPGQPGYHIRTLTVGLQLNVPLYSGGTQSAKVAEAIALRDKARDDLEAARRQATVGVKTAFFSWRAGLAKARASKIAISAAEKALAVAERGSARGLKTEADVLAARQQIAASRRDMRKGRYQQLTSYIKLKATLGDLSRVDIDELDQCFVAQLTDMPSTAALHDGSAP
ncbi:outer membrane protein [Dyella sp. OK004]|uniref:TolC family outer membrane protein n=1 Tax=Dyella sp. OK004 TaxID=1855292 RepID=UPI0008F0B4C4|nr:TolC family outer membrane protein [Dyella sp. OK004]SFS14258.1 outer membrane protein [Dyella sp. OK004]